LLLVFIVTGAARTYFAIDAMRKILYALQWTDEGMCPGDLSAGGLLYEGVSEEWWKRIRVIVRARNLW